jgi:uncharacterized protein YjiS (DUF1127 family)
VLAELKKSEDEYVNYNKELQALQEMILEELEDVGVWIEFIFGCV